MFLKIVDLRQFRKEGAICMLITFAFHFFAFCIDRITFDHFFAGKVFHINMFSFIIYINIVPSKEIMTSK